MGTPLILACYPPKLSAMVSEVAAIVCWCLPRDKPLRLVGYPWHIGYYYDEDKELGRWLGQWLGQ